VRTGTSTNREIVRGLPGRPTIEPRPPSPDNPKLAMSKTQELAERVERLLLRHEELQRTHDLLTQQLTAVTQERDSLRSRLNAARSRIDALLQRLPTEAPVGQDQ